MTYSVQNSELVEKLQSKILMQQIEIIDSIKKLPRANQIFTLQVLRNDNMKTFESNKNLPIQVKNIIAASTLKNQKIIENRLEQLKAI